ncbi:MAG TPA: STAS domain-containing protein [Planosporangium sp.]|nr:STAS domain-containing protein [Planosporangium sp.]
MQPSGGHLQPGPAGSAHRPRPVATRWAIGPVVGRADIPGLCERLTVLLRNTRAAVVTCDVGAITHPDIATIEVLARLRLTARRLGCDLRVHGANHRLTELLAVTGLDDVLGHSSGSVAEPRRQPEQGKQVLGIEEGVHPADPAR